MTRVACIVLTAGIALGVPSASAADPRAPLDEVLAAASRVRIEAHRIDQLLGDRQPDMAAVLQRLSVLQEHARMLQDGMVAIDVEAMVLVPHDRDALDTARRASQALVALLSNKAALLQDPTSVTEARRLIRAKARGIVRRATLVERQVSLVRG